MCNVIEVGFFNPRGSHDGLLLSTVCLCLTDLALLVRITFPRCLTTSARTSSWMAIQSILGCGTLQVLYCCGQVFASMPCRVRTAIPVHLLDLGSLCFRLFELWHMFLASIRLSVSLDLTLTLLP